MSRCRKEADTEGRRSQDLRKMSQTGMSVRGDGKQVGRCQGPGAGHLESRAPSRGDENVLDRGRGGGPMLRCTC